MPIGFDPVYNGQSRVLVLGSFPSVRSREIGFYYGHPQNRFWKMLSEIFKEPIGSDVESRRKFVLSHGVALWDVAISCEIEGSKDESMTEIVLADIPKLLAAAPIECVLCNGNRAFTETMKRFPSLDVPVVKMPSTSPRNRFFDQREWEKQFTILF